MADLKDMYTEEVLAEFALAFAAVEVDFPVQRFLAEVTQGDWEALSLRQRHERLARVLVVCLDRPFEQVAAFLEVVGARVQGFRYLFLPDVVALFGLEHFAASMKALAVLTESSTAEFAIRPFLQRDFERTFEQLQRWALSENEHQRRLASEGLRPNLPWGQKIPDLDQYRLEIWGLLENLKADPSLYVRKSVANHLNDWTRTNPEEVLDLLEAWQGPSPDTDWIVKRAARTLLKAGHPRALALFGYRSREDLVQVAWNFPKKISKGERLLLDYEVEVGQAGPLRLELQVEFRKPTGRVSRKSFMLRDREAASLRGTWSYDWIDKPTRKHWDGPHSLRLLLNGQVLLEGQVEVLGFADKKI
ncbi:DNA alkylation repair protein [Streptococcus danieliae]|uniref:DNA alkylation repair protein n=1 Tax=Streptococcus danieliae TaxID=747656 RepID=A0A7Z0S528_9STRE|nr:DNA alkylation repair protein [Streptococcus danieliae]MBF0699486.1 DNA alkylation repair protein [Streptococcus danieliae]NYS96662.1 DNA alkylation repair protein [Streptococcus danieliae]